MKGAAVCKLKEYVKLLTALASVINMAAVSIERCGDSALHCSGTRKHHQTLFKRAGNPILNTLSKPAKAIFSHA
jgi:hypothetical protein